MHEKIFNPQKGIQLPKSAAPSPKSFAPDVNAPSKPPSDSWSSSSSNDIDFFLEFEFFLFTESYFFLS